MGAAYPYPTPAALGATVVPSSKKRSSALPIVLVGLAVLLVGGGAAAAFGLGLVSLGGDDATASTADTSVPAGGTAPAATIDATGRPTPVAGGTARPKATGNTALSPAAPAAPAGADPIGAAKPGGGNAPTPTPPAPAPAAKKPFDVADAHAAVQKAGSNAQFHCKGKEGPKAVSATVFFNPSGGVQRVSISPQQAATQSGLCAQMMLGSARTKPFDGPDLGSVNTVGAIP
jgi:hypothetical protein